ncbi:hypothetical protein ACJX0J_015790, partial [Zea mays]
ELQTILFVAAGTLVTCQMIEMIRLSAFKGGGGECPNMDSITQFTVVVEENKHILKIKAEHFNLFFLMELVLFSILLQEVILYGTQSGQLFDSVKLNYHFYFFVVTMVMFTDKEGLKHSEIFGHMFLLDTLYTYFIIDLHILKSKFSKRILEIDFQTNLSKLYL